MYTTIDKELIFRIPKREMWQHLMSEAIANNMAFAWWKMPFENKQNFIIDLNKDSQTKKVELDGSEKGFLISPFINPELSQSHLIQPDLYWQWENEQNTQNGILDDYEKTNLKEIFIKNLTTRIKDSRSSRLLKIPRLGTIHHNVLSKEHFLDLVQKGIQSIESGLFQKIVLSRMKSVPLNQKFDVCQFLDKLSEIYPDAFVYTFHLPNVGFWVGASPELLLGMNEEGIFETVALAGTQRFDSNINLKDAVWSQKEIIEQALVSRYIINCFKKIRLREYEEEGPKTIHAGNVIHLKTTYKVNTKAVNFPELAAVMLPLLHPTSAVCGMPKQEAMDFILQNEGYNRKFYSGFIGPLNMKNETSLFVNLRCMEILNDQALLYVGAGITENSIPEKEWAETELKSQTLTNLL